MFDFRYHALSLAAVLIALAVGLLLGVAIGDANLVSNAEKQVVNTLRSNLDGARNRATALNSQLALRDQFENAAYAQLVGGKLAGRRIGLIFLGSPSDQLNALVRSALESTGGQVALVAVVRDPPSLPAVAAAAGGGRYAAIASDPALIRPFGVRVGVQLVTGGRLLGKVASPLLSTYNGTLQPKGGLGGIVIVRQAGNPTGPAAAVQTAFEDGLAAGFAGSGVPVVGAETSTTSPSEIPWYEQQNLSSVDDLDDIAGRVALAEVLAGGHGNFGRKATATSGLLPPAPGVASP
ncbi:MAG TPA: copper transporter [Solirubrobacteraceae bacterium]|nr:copper transporter [Solirubrobacteraceae bacterium]